MSPKQRAAEAALQHVQSGMVIGLGTGSTAEFFLQALAAALAAGRLRNVRGVPTSRASEQRAQQLGIPLTTLAEVPTLDLAIDGADEVAPNLDLIKGLGGALLREKLVAQNARTFIIIADLGKRVERLGTKSPLPVEVLSYSHQCHIPFFKGLGATPTLRRGADGSPLVTDNGNFIYDCRFPVIQNPKELESALLHRAGILDCGLFLGMAKFAIIADESGVHELRR